MNGKRVGLYLRVSTDDQTLENQRQALTEAIERRGWRIVETFEDNRSAVPRAGTSGFRSAAESADEAQDRRGCGMVGRSVTTAARRSRTPTGPAQSGGR